MEQEVYIDLYFLINACMDLLCMMLSAALLHRFVRRWRAILAASLGGLYAVAALLLGLDGISGFLLDMTVAVLICAVGFASRHLSARRFFQTVPVYLLVSVLLGGVMTALYALLNRLHLPLDSLQGDGLSVWSFALLTAVAGFATAKGGRFLGFSAKTKSVSLRITLFEKECTLRALVDSGNLLQDPLSGKRVIVADIRILRPSLPPALARALSSRDMTDWLSDPRYASHLRLIPIHTASGDAVLPAFIPKQLLITDQKDTYAADYLIALAPLGDSAKGFDAIIPLVG